MALGALGNIGNIGGIGGAGGAGGQNPIQRLLQALLRGGGGQQGGCSCGCGGQCCKGGGGCACGCAKRAGGILG